MCRVFLLLVLLISGWLPPAAAAPESESEPLRVRVTTSLGDIVIELDETRAPLSVANFLRYVDEKGFNNTIFHRVIVGFVVQGGGKYIDMSEAPDFEEVYNEADNGLLNVRGAVALARYDAIDSATREFFINVADNPTLDHSEQSCTRQEVADVEKARLKGLIKPLTCDTFGYSVFGHVISGMDVVDLVEIGETHSSHDSDDVPLRPIVILNVDRLDAR